MFDFLENIVDFIVAIISMIISFFKNVIQTLQLIFSSYAQLAVVISVIPIQYRVAILAFVSLSIIVTVVHFGE